MGIVIQTRQNQFGKQWRILDVAGHVLKDWNTANVMIAFLADVKRIDIVQ